ncbi:DNA-directed DNA polymerase [Tanacetum coccineum]
MHQNESLAIAGRNLFDDEASSSNNTRTKSSSLLKTLREYSCPNSSSIQNPIILPAERTGRIVDSRDILLIQGTCTFQELRSEDSLHHIKHYLSIMANIQADEATRDTSRLRFFHFSLKGKVEKWLDKIPPTQITTWDQLVLRFLDYFFPTGRTSSFRDMFLQFKQGDDESIKGAWIRFQNLIKQGNSKCKEKGEDDPEWVVRNKFEDKLANFMLEKKFHMKGVEEMLDQHSMIHMPKGAKVLKDLLLHKEKLEKATSLVMISEECSAIIQRSLPQKERDPGSFTLPCLIGPLAVKNALADLGASINLMPHSLFRRLGISKLKPNKMSIQLADQSIKYPIRVCKNLLIKVDTVDHDGKWTEAEEEGDSNEVQAVSFYPRAEPVEPLEWKALENRLKPSSVKPPELELNELPEQLEYDFLQENNQLPVVISSALSTIEKTRLLEVLKNHKVEITRSITDIKRIDSSFCTY